MEEIREKGEHYDNYNDPTVSPGALSAQSTSKSCVNKVNMSTDLEKHRNSHVQRGLVLGIARPIWIKVVENEERLNWMKKMVHRGLIVRDTEVFGKSLENKLRSDNAQILEDEKEILLTLMKLKCTQN